jgi:hypothetical protein
MARRLLLLFDGTHNGIGLQGTNVLRLYDTLVKDEDQLVYYDPGVGTLTDPNSLSRWATLKRQVVEMATGEDIGSNVVEAYRYLMRTYRAGDEISVFGFSRGAYTAKALAGMLHLCGLLNEGSENLAPYVWEAYRGGDKDKFKIAKIYRDCFCRQVDLKMLGLWDAVSSYGYFWDFRTLPFTRGNESVKIVRHAMALDERRGMFKVNHCQSANGNDCKEVWFVGFHSDVGGNPVPQARLSDLAFLWLAGEASNEADICFDMEKIKKIDPNPPDAPQSQMHNSMDWYWAIAEFVPIFAFSSRERRRRWRMPNFFRPRRVMKGETIHSSVAGWLKTGRYSRKGLPDDLKVADTQAVRSRPALPPRYWVYKDLVTSSSKLHLASCPWCNDGNGVHGGISRPHENMWIGPFDTSVDALESSKQSNLETVPCEHCKPT